MNYANLLSAYEINDGSVFVLAEKEEKYYSPKEYPYQEEIHNIIGACMEVHRALGHGFLESVYHEALCIELTRRGIPFETDKHIKVHYKDITLSKSFKADIYVYSHIIVELKAEMDSLDLQAPQIINYLSSTRHEAGLLVNFGLPSLQYKRYIVSKNRRAN